MACGAWQWSVNGCGADGCLGVPCFPSVRSVVHLSIHFVSRLALCAWRADRAGRPAVKQQMLSETPFWQADFGGPATLTDSGLQRRYMSVTNQVRTLPSEECGDLCSCRPLTLLSSLPIAPLAVLQAAV